VNMICNGSQVHQPWAFDMANGRNLKLEACQFPHVFPDCQFIVTHAVRFIQVGADVRAGVCWRVLAWPMDRRAFR
jgi:hypothetical protein